MARFRTTIKWTDVPGIGTLTTTKETVFPEDTQAYENMSRWASEGWGPPQKGPSIADPEGILGDYPRHTLVERLN